MEKDRVLEKLNEIRQAINNFYDEFNRVCANGTHSSLAKKLKPADKEKELNSKDIKHIRKIIRKMERLKGLL